MRLRSAVTYTRVNCTYFHDYDEDDDVDDDDDGILCNTTNERTTRRMYLFEQPTFTAAVMIGNK